MKKDIKELKVENIAIAAVPEQNEETGAEEWYIYLLNLKEEKVENVLVSSRGYGEVNREKVETSQLRHFVEELPAKSYVKIEPIMENLFGISNQYWVSFYIGRQIYDKKYVFLPETIQKQNLTSLPLMERKGVLLK